MRNNPLLIALLACLISYLAFPGVVTAQEENTDTVFKPTLLFSGLPRTYEIAGIEIKGAPNYDSSNILSYAGLKVGDRIEIPGDEITQASKRLWKQQLFSNVQITLDKTVGDKAWLTINLKQQPRVSSINYKGVRKGEKNDLEKSLGLTEGSTMTRNVSNRIKDIVTKYYADKGYGNATVIIDMADDLSKENEVIVTIDVDKNNKVKVNSITITGNEALSDNAVKGAMKKTREKGKLRNIFRSKKFVEQDYKDDLNRILSKYNEKGYRDAHIVADSVVRHDDKTVDVYVTVEEGKKYYINDVTWAGNTIYPSDKLAEILGIEKGDVYNQTLLDKRTMSDEDAIANYYMDNGYLFFRIIPLEKSVRGDSIDLEMMIYEGPQATINNVVINGNDRVYEKVIRRELRVKPGELFSKSDLQRSAREIASSGHFNPETMDIRPEPNEDNGTVDINFNLESKSSDQFEVSMGWGEIGVTGKVSVKFTNFSIKNLFYPSTYRGIIPQGEGQTFTLSAQTNARYYQAYSISFLDPWFGGKRPNSLSLSAYYSRQSDVNSSFQRNMYANNPYLYSMGGSYLGNGNDYWQNTMENAYDPNTLLQQIGVSVGLGKRLSWPDDWFTFQVSLGYQLYKLKNWRYLLDMNNGSSNTLTLGLTLSRNSTDNPLYTRSGSEFSIDLQLTPPASLFGKHDWAKLVKENTDAAKQTLYRWNEYWKLRFKSRTFTPLTSPENQYTLVLSTRADFGLLGSYNKYLRTPFETFFVGGDGMSGTYTYAQETIALRGYESGQFTPYSMGGGRAYTRYGVDLRFPFLMQSTTTIYGMLFAEAGNAWASISDFSPFDIKRSAGVGLRIFLPMVGMMGIDWAYGFDKVYGERGGSHFHFILGQEF